MMLAPPKPYQSTTDVCSTEPELPRVPTMTRSDAHLLCALADAPLLCQQQP
jgi:hypothetical protein